MASEAKLQILYFHSIREITGCTSESWPLNGASRTVSKLLDQLEIKYPRLRDHRDSMRVAVNETFSRPGALLNAGDTVALLPPVSGG
jgi:molybdopterin synthase sulfur carrier subunit